MTSRIRVLLMAFLAGLLAASTLTSCSGGGDQPTPHEALAAAK
jgi:hypothetical protein